MARRRSLLSSIWQPIANKLIGWLGGYNATDPRRKILDGFNSQLVASKTTANQLLNGNLGQLRAYCRDLERNNATARAVVEALAAQIVGTGISLEPDTGDKDLDGRIRDEFNAWVESAGVDGCSLYALQSLGVRELPTAGEVLWRLVYDDRAASAGEIPLRILPLDAEWIRDDEGGQSSLTTVAGIKIDDLGRPESYLLRNPETEDAPVEVPAEYVIHAFERRRPVQHRGEPWLAPVIEKLLKEGELVDAELKAAVVTASLGLVIESDYHDDLDTSDYGSSDDPVQSVKLGGVARLYPGEKIKAFSHDRPSQQIAPFRQMLRGDIAAGTRVSLRMLNRDIGNANYSSMRADMLDTQRIMAPVREWFGRQTIGRCYRAVLPWIAARLGIQVPSTKYRLIPDEVPYVDPEKDAQAALIAINGGLSTYEYEIGKRGGDWTETQAQRLKERQQNAVDEIQVLVAIQKAVNEANEAAPGLNLNWAQIATIGGATTAPGAYLAAATASQQASGMGETPEEPAPPVEQEPQEDADDMDNSQHELGGSENADRVM